VSNEPFRKDAYWLVSSGICPLRVSATDVSNDSLTKRWLVVGMRRFVKPAMTRFDFGQILEGNLDSISKAYEHFSALSVDQVWEDETPSPALENASTIEKAVEVSAPGTFAKNSIRTLRLEPTERSGWWFDRTDLPDSQPIKCSIRNVWTTGEVVSNIVLRSGSAKNYVRLVEHIIALRAGMDVDNLLIRCDSGDPPLFNAGSKELVDALRGSGRAPSGQRVRYFTVRETVTLATPHGGFITLSPRGSNKRELRIDCARDFPNAIGQQRIQFVLNESSFLHGSTARTNASSSQKLFISTIGKLFADTRNLGYNKQNVLIAGKAHYVNAPTHMHEGKSLEAAWHRAILDLLAALALIDEGRFVGTITDYKGGHFPDVEMIKLLYANDLLVGV